MKKKYHAIILARGGSKGIKNKNIIDFCGKPLLVWTIEQAIQSKYISSIWVSSDNEKILKLAKHSGAEIIERPKKFASDTSSSINAYIHAISYIEKFNSIDSIVALQVTSPIRESIDIDRAILKFEKFNYDSLFSGAEIGDFYIWKIKNQKLKSINYNYKKRQRRQDFEKQYVENGSIYIFKPSVIKKYKNQLGGKIGISLMDFWKSFEIDDNFDLEFCKMIMNNYLLKTLKTRL